MPSDNLMDIQVLSIKKGSAASSSTLTNLEPQFISYRSSQGNISSVIIRKPGLCYCNEVSLAVINKIHKTGRFISKRLYIQSTHAVLTARWIPFCNGTLMRLLKLTDHRHLLDWLAETVIDNWDPHRALHTCRGRRIKLIVGMCMHLQVSIISAAPVSPYAWKDSQDLNTIINRSKQVLFRTRCK